MQGWSYSEFRVPTQRQISAITYCFGSLIKFFSRKSRHSRHDIDRNAPCMLSFSLCLSLLFFFGSCFISVYSRNSVRRLYINGIIALDRARLSSGGGGRDD